MTSGLALMAGLPDDARGLPIHLSIDYHMKARGVITALCDCDPPATSEPTETELRCTMSNAAGQPVATATARWKVGPKKTG